MIDRARLDAAYRTSLDALLKERHPDGYWVGELSTSALSTATAVMALHLTQREGHDHRRLIDGGLAWLAAHQNADGGWGDTDKSFSNISTTMLCRAAFYLTASGGREPLDYSSPPPEQPSNQGADAPRSPYADTIRRAEEWLFSRYGDTPAQLAEAVRQRYGKDRTFAVPILTTCAIAGLVSWDEVPPLPFELACLPQSWFRFLRLHVVSYALPALIAIGQCVYHHKKPWNPLTRVIRALSRRRSLRVLRRIQPSSGGYLEATPLTSFVVLSLAASGLADHEVAREGVRFLVSGVRPDGSWPIDSNLSTWVTTLAINALAVAGELEHLEKRDELRDWLLHQQHRDYHPYTGAAPGGWAWTPLPGGVPDGDDTPGALLALRQRPPLDLWELSAALQWLLNLQNYDGGFPTFCKGWSHLPFDRSGNDLTAHAVRALAAWRASIGEGIFYDSLFDNLTITDDLFLWWKRKRVDYAVKAGFGFLAHSQGPDGSWLPLWFGNQHAPDDENPVYGTARVLAAYRDLELLGDEPARRGIAFLLSVQNADGGWGGAKDTPSSMEETALAVEVLLDGGADAAAAVEQGLAWLIDHVERGDLHNPTPIGFYFAKLWYYEKLYPIIFTVAALGRARVKYTSGAVI